MPELCAAFTSLTTRITAGSVAQQVDMPLVVGII